MEIRDRKMTPEEEKRIEEIDTGFEVSPVVQRLTRDMQSTNKNQDQLDHDDQESDGILNPFARFPDPIEAVLEAQRYMH